MLIKCLVTVFSFVCYCGVFFVYLLVFFVCLFVLCCFAAFVVVGCFSLRNLVATS